MTPVIACTRVNYVRSRLPILLKIPGQPTVSTQSRCPTLHRYQDGIDFVPTKPSSYWSSQCTLRISTDVRTCNRCHLGLGAGFLWVVFGSLIGCVHDFSALVLSVRAKGLSVGTLAEGIWVHERSGCFLRYLFWNFLGDGCLRLRDCEAVWFVFKAPDGEWH